MDTFSQTNSHWIVIYRTPVAQGVHNVRRMLLTTVDSDLSSEFSINGTRLIGYTYFERPYYFFFLPFDCTYHLRYCNIRVGTRVSDITEGKRTDCFPLLEGPQNDTTLLSRSQPALRCVVVKRVGELQFGPKCPGN